MIGLHGCKALWIWYVHCEALVASHISQQAFDVTFRLKQFDGTKRAHMARYNSVQTCTKRRHSIGGA